MVQLCNSIITFGTLEGLEFIGYMCGSSVEGDKKSPKLFQCLVESFFLSLLISHGE